MTNAEARALDIKIAEKLFGYVRCDAWEHTMTKDESYQLTKKPCEHEHCYPAKDVGGTLGPIGGPPAYSTDIGHAWKVVGELTRLSNVDLLSAGREGWSVEIDAMFYATAPTAPEAICRAALKAIN